MSNIRELVFGKLKNDSVLTNLLDSSATPKIFFHFPPKSVVENRVFPRVTYYILNSSDTLEAAGDDVRNQVHSLNVSIYSTSYPQLIIDRVDALIRSIKDHVEMVSLNDRYEPDEQVYGVNITYRIKEV